MSKGLSHSLANGHRPDVFATFTRDTTFNVGTLTPLHEQAAPRLPWIPGDLQRTLIRQFYKRIGKADAWSDHYAAQSWLAGEVATLERERLSVAFDDFEIRLRAERGARMCGIMGGLPAMQEYALACGIEPPRLRDIVGPPEPQALRACILRLRCPRWWRRAMRRTYTRRAETHLRALGIVHKRRQVYASDRAVAWRRERKIRDRALLEEMEAVSDAGDQLNLFEVVARSQANPALRRAELMTRLSGFEECAKAAAHEALFITLTTPSAYHRTLATGAANPLFQGFSPREGQAWLAKMWARARSKFKRLSLVLYGFRIAEPHHDGTPHWHMVLFARPRHLEAMRDVLQLLFLSEFSEEAGARAHRVKFERIRPEAGSATGYLAKYVAKNIDGFQVGADHETQGLDASDSCDRVAAWASAHGIRQFQQIGGPPVGVWRELRRLRASVEGATLERARQHADAGDWCGFVVAFGGIEAGRRGLVQLWKERTGEISQYGELRAPVVAGVESCDARVRTRHKVWSIQRKRPASDPSRSDAHITAQRTLSAASPAVPFARSDSHLGPVSTTVRTLSGITARDGSQVREWLESRGAPITARESDREWQAAISVGRSVRWIN